MIPLTQSGGADPSKVFPDGAVVVIRSTRGNASWVDADIDRARDTLRTRNPRADGVFNIIVKDAYGRSTRFNLEYDKWNTLKDNEDDPPNFIYIARRRWWEPGGEGLSPDVDDEYREVERFDDSDDRP